MFFIAYYPDTARLVSLRGKIALRVHIVKAVSGVIKPPFGKVVFSVRQERSEGLTFI
jgi:hypothetical protein